MKFKNRDFNGRKIGMSRGGLDSFEDERLLALLRGKLQLNNSFHCSLKSSKPKRSKSAYFGHSHEPVNILRAPRNGRLIDVGHKGFRVNHTTGDAVRHLSFIPHIISHLYNVIFFIKGSSI